MRLHRQIPATRAEGPGLRYTLWVQGCRNGCPGCYATDLWDPAGGYEVSPEEVLRQIRETPGIEGVTFLGGEPMEQARDLARVAQGARDLGLSVLTFTGLTYEYLLAEGTPDQAQLLGLTDLLIDGPFLREQQDYSRPWVGSRNQRYLFLTDRYGPEDIDACRNRVELRLDRDGTLRLNGMGDFAALERILQNKTFMRGNEDGIHKL